MIPSFSVWNALRIRYCFILETNKVRPDVWGQPAMPTAARREETEIRDEDLGMTLTETQTGAQGDHNLPDLLTDPGVLRRVETPEGSRWHRPQAMGA